MSGYENFRGRAKPKPHVPPPPNFTVEERLDACLDIADRIERGDNSPVDDLTLLAHLKVLHGSDVAIAARLTELAATLNAPEAENGQSVPR